MRGKELIQSEWSRLCGRKERQLYQEVVEVNFAWSLGVHR